MDAVRERDTRALRAVRWSVLDRALIRRGQRPAEALRASVRFARQVEALGYHRFWVAEHHGVPGVAGSSPTVLAAAVAAATHRVRVGTGGVMLPNHAPLVVAEQFGVLESLHPGRIDMGLGRSVGFTDGVRRALGVGKDAADRFGTQLDELLRYFDDGPSHGGPSSDGSPPDGPSSGGSSPGGSSLGDPEVRAQPARGLRVPAYLLALGAGADIAAARGLPLVLAHQRDGERTLAALERYRAGFTPSAHAARPYVILAVNVAVAATGEDAATLQLPEAWATVRSRTSGVFPPLEPPEEIRARDLTEREHRYLAQARGSQVHGDEAGVAAALTDLLARTGADEVLVTLTTHGEEERLDSYRRLARLTGLTSLPGPPGSGTEAGPAVQG